MNLTNDAITDELQYAPDCSPEQIEQVLSSLDRWSARTAKHVVHRRRAERHQYQTQVTIELYDAQDADATPRQIFTVMTRNLSKAGLGFVIPPVLVPRLLSDETPLVRTEATFRLGMKMRVTLGPPTGSMPTVWAEIVRVRPVHFGFFEIGVRFLDREPT